jgi:hypothetical protein
MSSVRTELVIRTESHPDEETAPVTDARPSDTKHAMDKLCASTEVALADVHDGASADLSGFGTSYRFARNLVVAVLADLPAMD